jgi:uncharacterized OB-fold protein
MLDQRQETSPLDPRPKVVEGPDGAELEGARCDLCGYRLAVEAPRCPACGGAVSPARFGPAGTVWSSTTVRIVVQQRPAPYVLAYVDLDEGPRVLAHVETDDDLPLRVGTRVVLTGTTPEGDPAVSPAG